MALPLFYLPSLSITENVIQLDEATSKHAIQVLRMKNGEHLQLTNGKGLLVEVEIIQEHKKSAKATIVSHHTTVAAKSKITIAISPIKNTSRFEWFLEKATEIGIQKIIPVICKRTEKLHLKHERMQSILVSAMLQSQQSWLPEIIEAVKFENLVRQNFEGKKFIAHCIDLEKKSLKDYSDDASAKIILIGPEGDFTSDEIALAMQNDFLPVTLGDTRLRTETAGMVAAVMLKN